MVSDDLLYWNAEYISQYFLYMHAKILANCFGDVASQYCARWVKQMLDHGKRAKMNNIIISGKVLCVFICHQNHLHFFAMNCSINQLTY